MLCDSFYRFALLCRKSVFHNELIKTNTSALEGTDMDLNTRKKLNNGVEMPIFGLGVYKSADGEET